MTDKPLSKPIRSRRRYLAVTIILGLLLLLFVQLSFHRATLDTVKVEEFIKLPKHNRWFVDDFSAFESTWKHKLQPPEDNGQRLMIATCGPIVLEQSGIAKNVPWEEITTHEYSKGWFANYWTPLCEAMGINPNEKPKYYESRDFFSIKEQHKDGMKLWNELAGKPWSAAEYPEVAAWLKDRSPVLDLFGEAVRKPNYACWRKRSESGKLDDIILPDLQANRNFARDLRIRITERLNRNDIDGAWYDTMSLFHLAQDHYLHDSLKITRLIGVGCNQLADQAAELILKYGKPSPEQLKRIEKDIEAYPRKVEVKW